MSGWAAKWKSSRIDRIGRLAKAIESLAEADRRTIDEAARVDRLRSRGALDLYCICREFVDKVNARLPAPAILLDPPSYSEKNYNDSGLNLLQINLRGRILQIEFEATAELYEDDDFPERYILRGAVRSFNRDLLEHGSVGEQTIFYCPANGAAFWHYSDDRTYRTGKLTEDYLVAEMERLL